MTDQDLGAFDSRAPIGKGQAVYVSARAEELTGAELLRGIEVFSRVSQAHGASAWLPDDVRAPALHRSTEQPQPSTRCWTRPAPESTSGSR